MSHRHEGLGRFDPAVQEAMASMPPQGDTLTAERPADADATVTNPDTNVDTEGQSTDQHNTANDHEAEDAPSFDISTKQYNAVYARTDVKKGTKYVQEEVESLNDAKYEFLRHATDTQLQKQGIYDDDALKLSRPIADLAFVVREVAAGEAVTDDVLDFMSERRADLNATIDITSKSEDDYAVDTAVAEVLRGAVGTENAAVAKDLANKVRAYDDARIEKTGGDTTTEAKASTEEQAESADESTTESADEAAAETTADKPSGVYSKKGSDLGKFAREDVGARVNSTVTPSGKVKINSVSPTDGIPREWPAGNEYEPAAKKGMGVERHATEFGKANQDATGEKTRAVEKAQTSVEVFQESVEANEDYLKAHGVLVEARKEYAMLSAKRRRITTAGHAKKLEAARKSYEEANNTVGAIVAGELKRHGISDTDIKKIAIVGANLQANVLVGDIVRSEQDLAGNNKKLAKFYDWWARNTTEPNQDNGFFKNIVAQVNKGNLKKAGVMGSVGLAAGVPAAALVAVAFGPMAAAGAGLVGARAITRSIASGRIARNARVRKDAMSESQAIATTTGSPNVAPVAGTADRTIAFERGSRTMNGAFQAHMNAIRDNDAFSPEAKDITRFIEAETRRNVTGNRRRAAMSAGAAVIGGTLGAEIVQSMGLGGRFGGIGDRVRSLGSNGRSDQASFAWQDEARNNGGDSGIRFVGESDGSASANAAENTAMREANVNRNAGATTTAAAERFRDSLGGTNTDPEAVTDAAAARFQDMLNNNAATEGMNANTLQNVGGQLANGATEINIPVLQGEGMAAQLQNGLGLNAAQSRDALQWLIDQGYINADGSGGIAGVKGTSVDNIVNYSTGAGDGQYHIPRKAITDLMERYGRENFDLAA